MKHFTHELVSQNIFTMSPSDSFTSERFIAAQRALVIAMDANPSDLTTSEEAVLTDFISWFKGVKEDLVLVFKNEKFLISKPVFVYVNVSSGDTQLFTVADYSGEMFGRPSYV